MEETKQETLEETQSSYELSPFNSITAAAENTFLNNPEFGKRHLHTAHLIGDHIVVIFGDGEDYNGRYLLGDR